MIRSCATAVVVAAAALLTAGCSDADAPTAQATETGVTRTVVPGITREATAPVRPNAGSVTITDAFPALPDIERPTVMVEVPGQAAFLVASQDGIVYAVAKDDGAGALNEALDWRSRTSRDGNEEGLLGLALSPNFASDGFAFLYYSAAGGRRRSVISRFATSGTGTRLRILPDSELVIMEVAQPQSNHNGGNILFGPDGMFYIGLGDGGGGGDPEGNAQNPGTLLGSILRIDVSGATAASPYRIPPGNPLASNPRTRPETYAFGFRNPWRFSFDRKTGDMWAGDVGQEEREEIDLVKPGGNYGWNIMEGFSCYEASTCNRTGLEMPVADYGREGGNCSVTGGYVAHGPSAGSLEGWYVYGDYCSGRIWAVEAAKASSRPDAVILRTKGPRLASFAEDLDGNVYLLAFDGRIYRLEG